MLFEETEFLLGEWTIDPLHGVIEKDQQQKKVENRLMKVLVLLANNPEKGMSKNDLLNSVWQDKVASDETLSVAISQLRKLLGCSAKEPKYIATITGFGYKLIVAPAPIDKTPQATLEVKQKKSTGLSKNKIFIFLGLVLFISSILFFSLQSKQELKEEQLLANDSYSKAIYLMLQELEDAKQAEILLSNLNTQHPKNAFILTALGKSIYFQAKHAEINNQEAIINKSKKIFMEALEFSSKDTNKADIYLQLALIAFYFDHKYELAENYFIQSKALDPTESITHAAYSYLLLTQMRYKEAIHQNRVAQSIDPIHYSSIAVQWAYYMTGEYEQAKKELAKLYSIDPTSEEYRSTALNLYEAIKDEETAFRYYLEKFQTVGYSEQELADAQAAFENGGLKALNYWLANIKKEQLNIGQYLPPFSTARYHIGAGEYETAIDILELAVKNKEPDSIWLNADPKYAPLKEFPRFNKLLKQLGF